MWSSDYVNRPEALRSLSAARIAHLATITPNRSPHIVPVTFARLDGMIVTMVDHKPKTTTRLQRLVNIEAEARVSILTDHYSDDWDELWWVRVDGLAELYERGDMWEASREALAKKYGQYRDRLPQGAAIVIHPEHVTWWSSTP